MFLFTSSFTTLSQGPLPHPPPYPPESFDRVLLDAPCSALGQRPQIKCPLSLVDLKSFQSYQRHFLTQVHCKHCISLLLRPSVPPTCSTLLSRPPALPFCPTHLLHPSVPPPGCWPAETWRYSGIFNMYIHTGGE